MRCPVCERRIETAGVIEADGVVLCNEVCASVPRSQWRVFFFERRPDVPPPEPSPYTKITYRRETRCKDLW